MAIGANGEDLVPAINHAVEVYKLDTDHVITHHLHMVENHVLALTLIHNTVTLTNAQVYLATIYLLEVF